PRRRARARGARARLGGPAHGPPHRLVPRRAGLSDRRRLLGGHAHLVLAAPPRRRDACERLLLLEPDLRDLPRRAAPQRATRRARLPRRSGRRPRDLARPARLVAYRIIEERHGSAGRPEPPGGTRGLGGHLVVPIFNESAEPRPHLVGEPRHRLEHLGPRARPAVEDRVRRPEGHDGLELLDHLGGRADEDAARLLGGPARGVAAGPDHADAVAHAEPTGVGGPPGGLHLLAQVPEVLAQLLRRDPERVPALAVPRRAADRRATVAADEDRRARR